jgi:hypothetical protein
MLWVYTVEDLLKLHSDVSRATIRVVVGELKHNLCTHIVPESSATNK